MSKWMTRARATLLAAMGVFVTTAGLAVASTDSRAGEARPLKIGIIGAGKIGGSLAALWVKAGHEVLVSSRHPEELEALARSLGPKAHVGTPREAAVFGDVILLSVPYGALPQIGRDLEKELKGKVVLDTGNPYPERDGDMALEARRKGTGIASAELLPGVRLVRAFNAISYRNLRSEAHRAGAPIGIPIAGDDDQALAVAMRLVRDAGFDPVLVGPLARAKSFDVGSPVYTQLLTARELRARLGL
jgi:predicted dinucleotide-binding enzyme